MGIICQSFTLVFLIIRLYAIFEMRRWILFATVPFGLLTIVLSSLALGTAEIMTVSRTSRDTGTADGHSSSLRVSSFCFPTPNFARNDSLYLYRLSYIINISFDTLVFILAIFQMRRMRRAGPLCRSQSSIVWILFRDGIVLYAILTISNLFNFVIFLLYFNRELSGDSVGPVPIAYFKHFFVVSSGTSSEMTHTLSVILVSRMIFNLREVGTQIGEGTEEWRSRIERGVGEAWIIHRFDERCFSPRQATFIKLPITCIIPDTCTALFILFSISRSSYFLIIIIMQWTLIYVATHSLSQAYPLFVGILCIKYPV